MDQLYNFNPEDLIIVQWTAPAREAFWNGKNWVASGSVYNNPYYDDAYVERYTSQINYLYRDLSIVKVIQGFMKLKGCTFHQISMSPILDLELYGGRLEDILPEQKQYLLDLYKPVIDQIKPSYMEVVFEGNWRNKLPRPKFRLSTTKDICDDCHPSPLEHLKYVEQILPFVPITPDLRNNVQIDNARVMSTVNEYVQRYCNPPLNGTLPFTRGCSKSEF